MTGTSLLIVTAAGLCASALVALCLGPRRPPATPVAEAPGPPAAPAEASPATAGLEAARLPLGERMARSRILRRSLGALTVVLVVAAGVSITWPFWTDQYQHRLQVKLDRQLDEQIESPQAAEEFAAGEVRSGDSLTRLRAPSIGVEVVVVEGTTQAALRAGAGHYPETALPCGSGNVAIAGHRTTFGKPFNRLDEVVPGDEITLETPLGTCRYRVSEAAFVVTPDQIEVVAPTDTPRLTLTTCHPKGSARERLVLHADLVGDPLLEDRGGRTPPDIRGEA
ncbi:MAG TPA: class E sortase [Iamia sp.]|nr:class E sortase [Iamia sp.]